jgi:hypothetical protein
MVVILTGKRDDLVFQITSAANIADMLGLRPE